MKTKKYSNSIKALATLGIIFMISSAAFSQQVIEERKGGVSTYSVAAGAASDQYTWTIAAETLLPPTVVPAPTIGSGTIADPFVIDWTDNQTSIQVTWAADGAPDIASTAGEVTVQKRTTVGAICPSPIQTMDISFWSNPTAGIDVVTSPDQEVCSTDPILGTITIDLTGAPDAGQSGDPGFDLVYDVAVSDPAFLSVTGSNGPTGNGQTVQSDGATVTIPLPDALLNTDTNIHTYTITLRTIQDDFNEAPVAVLGQVYTIQVHPTPSTGLINSTGALGRR